MEDYSLHILFVIVVLYCGASKAIILSMYVGGENPPILWNQKGTSRALTAHVFRSFYSLTGSLIVTRDTVGVLISDTYQVMVQNLAVNFSSYYIANGLQLRIAKQN